MRWVKTSERMPTEADTDHSGEVVVRWPYTRSSWHVGAARPDELDDEDEWLEGALADIRSPNGRGNHSVGPDYSTLGGTEQ